MVTHSWVSPTGRAPGGSKNNKTKRYMCLPANPLKIKVKSKSQTRDRNIAQPESRESLEKHWGEVARIFRQTMVTKPHPLSAGEALLVSAQNLARYFRVGGRLSLSGSGRRSARQKSVSSSSQNISP